jgi:DNA-3-methyladenine glycosylase I
MTEEMKPPDWVYKDKRPTTDTEYFKNLTRCIFQAGLSWQLMSRKWPNFEKAFHQFDIAKIAAYGAEDIRRLSEDTTIIRNKQKIVATIQNAREFERIAREHGSFQSWLDTIDKSHNYDRVVKSLRSRLRPVRACSKSWVYNHRTA